MTLRGTGSAEVFTGALVGAALLGLFAGLGALVRPISDDAAAALPRAGLFDFPSSGITEDSAGRTDSPSDRASSSLPEREAKPLTPPPSREPVVLPPWSSPTGTPAGGRPSVPDEVDLEHPDYQRIVQAAGKSSPADVIVMIESFRTRHRDDRYQPHLESLLETALDRLWWQRISELITQRREVSQRISALNVKATRSDDPAERRRITEESETLRSRLDRAASDLRAMNYTAADAPDLENPEQLDALRAERDTTQYQIWKSRVRSSIQKTRGRLPWEAD